MTFKRLSVFFRILFWSNSEKLVVTPSTDSEIDLESKLKKNGKCGLIGFNTFK